ncbi:hypothetical protein DICPUDRAFT_146587 [Dictyostelium purpureum]|uniref:Uncharacterized protein n=1 Tax=Dictyostelium purpureum TaxID=5786 RepID=F0Z6C6_DICPU|nr:uncharacterized protein DICPUDRAFT_146587 [Dictyostelium purpureum]EGC40466.1 hypothetical protein DICPUDRAFT_146587 [Dictyostelium purpureum]|eukprot:XP_003283013.1 hypothetical protein DICPUDRAFT_146587 [Dictyostelium purpureum]
MTRIGKDKDQLIDEEPHPQSNSNNNNKLNWSNINKQYYKYINSIVNEINIPPRRELMSTISSQCPFELNFKVKWLYEACKAIHSIKFYNSDKEVVEVSKKNGGGYLRTNFFISQDELAEIFYLEIGKLSTLYSKSIQYYCIFGNNEFQTIEFSNSGFRISKQLFLNSFKYGKYELLNEYLLKTIEKYPENVIITTVQQELDPEIYNSSKNSVAKEKVTNKSLSLLFKYYNDLMDVLKHRVYNFKTLHINSIMDKKKIEKYRKLFIFIKSVKDKVFFKILLSNYLRVFVRFDFDKLIEAIYETDNVRAMSSLYETLEELIINERIYTIDTVAFRFEGFISKYHSYKVSSYILKKFYFSKSNSAINLQKELEKAKNCKHVSILYSNKVLNSKVNISSYSDDKIITSDLVWNSVMNRLSKDREILQLEQQEVLPPENKNNHDENTINYRDYVNKLNWSKIFKNCFRFIKIINELNIPPPLKNFKFFSPESWRLLMSTPYNCIEISKRNGGGILRINYIVTQDEIDKMSFSEYELNLRITEIDLTQSINLKIKNLLRSYLEIGKLSTLYSKNIQYYCIFGNDEFQTIEFSNETFSSFQINPNASSNFNGILINKKLFLNSFKYGKYELLNEYLLKSIEKDPVNVIISTIQHEIDIITNQNNSSKLPSLLFKHCNNSDSQEQFLKQIFLIINNNSIMISHKLNPHFILSLIILTDDINLINFSAQLFKDLLKTNNNGNKNFNNNKSVLSIVNNYKNLLLYTQSSKTLKLLLELFNNQNFNKKELFDYQVWFFNGRLDLLSTFIELNCDSLRFISLKECNFKPNSKQYKNYLSSCKYAISRKESFQFSTSIIKESVLHTNFCKERFTTSKDIENFKYIIENTNETYRPLELLSHLPYAINLPIAKFCSWIINNRFFDIRNNRCIVNRSEIKLLEYYANKLTIEGGPFSHFIADSKSVLDAIASCGDFGTIQQVYNRFTTEEKKLDQNLIKTFIELGDHRILKLFDWNNKFYKKTLVKLALYHDHVVVVISIFRTNFIIDNDKLKRSSYRNKYSSLDYLKLSAYQVTENVTFFN